jgi:hypothetical protein
LSTRQASSHVDHVTRQGFDCLHVSDKISRFQAAFILFSAAPETELHGLARAVAELLRPQRSLRETSDSLNK